MIQPQTPPRPIVYTPPLEPYLTVLHHDADLLVVSKPSGLLAVPGRGPDRADCVAARAAGHAAATAHVVSHAKGAVWYGEKAEKAA